LQWSSSVRLERNPNGFEGPVRIPFGEKIQYKFIVDGRWVTNDRAPTEADGGFINNVYTAPPRPATVLAQEPELAANGSAVTAPQNVTSEALPVDGAPAPSADGSFKPTPKEVKDGSSKPMLEELKDEPALEEAKVVSPEPVSEEAKVEPSEPVLEEAKDVPSEPATEEVKDTAIPVADATTEGIRKPSTNLTEETDVPYEAPVTPPPTQMPLRPESPSKPTMFDYAKGVAASFFPTLSPKVWCLFNFT
jgi:hypothetical protein